MEIINKQDFCNGDNCSFSYFSKFLQKELPDELNIDKNPSLVKYYKTYSVFLVSLKPYRFIIARAYDNHFIPHLNLYYKRYTCDYRKIREDFTEWYDIFMDHNFVIHCLYYHNMEMLISGDINIITGNVCVNYFNKDMNIWTKQLWNKFYNILYFDNTNIKFDLNFNLIYVIIALIQKYNFLTIKVDIDDCFNFISLIE